MIAIDARGSAAIASTINVGGERGTVVIGRELPRVVRSCSITSPARAGSASAARRRTLSDRARARTRGRSRIRTS